MNLKSFTLLAALFCFTQQAFATHLAAADFRYTHITGNQYLVSLYLYRDCAGINLTPSASITIESSSCGISNSVTLPLFATNTVTALPNTQTTCNGGTLPGYEEWLYKDTITLSATCTDWTLNYTNCCRNNAITNLVTPGNRSFSISTTIDNSTGINNNSPRYFIDPLFYGSMGANFSAALGGIDPDGDSLAFTIAAPVENSTPIPFQTGLTVSQPLLVAPSTSITFSGTTGQFNCTLATGAQIVVFDVIVEEFRNGVKIAEHRRSLQLLPINLGNNSCMSNPNSTVTGGGSILAANTIGYQNGQPLSFNLQFSDPDANDVISYNNTLSSIMSSFPNAQVIATNPAGNSNQLSLDITIPTPTETFVMILVEENGLLQHSFTFELKSANITSTQKLSSTQQIKVYPNPMYALTTFETEKTYQQLHLQLYDAAGKQVLEQTSYKQQQLQISRNNLPSGMYFYQLLGDGAVLKSDILQVK